jgi:hypothetical protein
MRRGSAGSDRTEGSHSCYAPGGPGPKRQQIDVRWPTFNICERLPFAEPPPPSREGDRPSLAAALCG